jgi:predicted nucleic acid-binding protein
LRVFVDTNIFLDILFKRKFYEDSLAVLDACLDGIFEGYICDITLLNIDYIASKQSKDVKKFLKIINSSFQVVGANNDIFDNAFKIDNDDLEDNVQYICALKAKCNIIVTNDNGFVKGEIEVLNPQKVMKLISK